MLSEPFLNKIAHSVYQAVRAWDTEHGVKNIPDWADTDEDTRAVVIKRIKATLADPRAGDATYHNEWVKNQQKEGWSGGKPYDEARKVDPNCVPFHLLAPDQQARERLMRAVILSLSRV